MRNKGLKRYAILAIVFVSGVSTSAVFILVFSFFERNDGTVKHTLDSGHTSTISESDTSDDQTRITNAWPDESKRQEILTQNEIEKMEGPLERAAVLLAVLRRAREDQVLALLEQSKQLDPPGREQTQAFILQKLVRTNPISAMTQAAKFSRPRSNDLLFALFSEWAQLDLNEAISNATALDSTGQQAALEGILQERIDLTDQKRREIARQLGNEQYAINMITLEKLTKSIAEPEDVWKEMVEEEQNDRNQIELLTQVAQIWVDKRGVDALDQIFATLDNSQTRSQISIAVFREIAHTHPSAAFEYCLTLDNVPYYDSVLILVEEWVKSDPRDALDAVVSIAGIRSLRGQFRSLVETVATYNPRSILEHVDLIPNDMVELATRTAISVLASNFPLDAAARVPTVEDESLKEDVARSVIDHWIARDMDATLDWVLEDSDTEFQRTRLLGYVLLTLVEHDPERAIRVALAHPIVENELGPEYWVISQLGQTDVDKAIKYMPKVRDGVTKTTAYRGLGWELVTKGMTDKALQLLQEIPQYAKKPYLSQIFGAWHGRDPINLFESLDQLPSAEVTSAAALKLLRNDPWGEHLNSEQMEAARARLTEEDSKQLKRHNLKVLETRGRLR